MEPIASFSIALSYSFINHLQINGSANLDSDIQVNVK